MESKIYMINMQKILFVAEMLHQKGYENLKVFPYLAPSGLHWRCEFKPFQSQNKYLQFNASSWFQKNFNLNEEELTISISEITKLLIHEELDFLNNCFGKNTKYVQWFQNCIKNLEIGELPYELADFEIPENRWETSIGKTIDLKNYQTSSE